MVDRNERTLQEKFLLQADLFVLQSSVTLGRRFVPHLLGFLRHHEHEVKVVGSQGVFIQVVDIDEEEEEL